MTHIIKKGPIKVSTQPKDFDLQATGLVFKSYDNQIALEFNVTQQDGTPADLLGANLRLLMFIYDEVDGTIKKEPIPFITKNLITESFLNGHVVYILPEAMKAYNGMVEAYVYIEYPDGSTSDNLGFTFRMKRSAIDGLAQDKADYFIADFQQLLDGVKQEATDAVNEVLAKVEASSTAKMQELEAVLDAEAKRLTEHANQNNQKITEYDQKFQQTAQNIATLDQNLNELRNDLKLSEAWAWSADGTDRFTDKYPIDNLLPNSMFNSQMGWTASMSDVGSTQSGIANGEAWLEDLTATTNRWKQWQIYFDNNRYPDTFELIKANPNKRVTVSVDAKVEGNTIKYPGVVDLSLRSSTGDNWVRLRVDDTKISSEYTRYTAIGTLPSDFNNVQNFRLLLTFNGNGRATFTKPKLAIGNDGFYTPAPSEDYENAYPQYRGLALLPSDLPDDYSWDITPEYTEKSLNNTVSLTEPQTVLGLKNFSDGIQIAGDRVVGENEHVVYTLDASNSKSFIDGYATFIKHGKEVIVNGTVKFKKTYPFGTTLEDVLPDEFVAKIVHGMLTGPSGTSSVSKAMYVRKDLGTIITNSEFAANEWFTFHGNYWVGEE
ncbi:TPA: BppU family phage baseplate upper protein [Enterococcus faecium]